MQRARVEADLPRLPLAWFDAAIDVPAWDAYPCAYLRLSKLFEPEALTARARGWPLVHVDGTYLHPAIEPGATADSLLTLANILAPTTPHCRTGGSTPIDR